MFEWYVTDEMMKRDGKVTAGRDCVKGHVGLPFPSWPFWSFVETLYRSTERVFQPQPQIKSTDAEAESKAKSTIGTLHS